MKFKYKSPKSIIAELCKWHDYFCWLPVQVDDALVWLETIERKGDWKYFYGDFFTIYEYRLKEQTND